MNHILSHFFVDEEDSPPLDIHINHESAIFDMYEYENYDILSSYFSRRFGRQLTYEEIDEKINNFFSGEKYVNTYINNLYVFNIGIIFKKNKNRYKKI